MDMIFRNDEYRLPTDQAAANSRSQAHVNLIRRVPNKDAIRLGRRVAAWDDDFSRKPHRP
jgi:hypothetical protein